MSDFFDSQNHAVILYGRKVSLNASVAQVQALNAAVQALAAQLELPLALVSPALMEDPVEHGGVIGLVLAWNPPPLIGLFAQKGVYGLAAASLVPVLFGVLVRRHIPLWVVMGAAAIGLVLHLYLNLLGGVENPAVSATYAIFASLGFGLIGLAVSRNAPNPHPVET